MAERAPFDVDLQQRDTVAGSSNDRPDPRLSAGRLLDVVADDGCGMTQPSIITPDPRLSDGDRAIRTPDRRHKNTERRAAVER
jgi:hypothetical protein